MCAWGAGCGGGAAQQAQDVVVHPVGGGDEGRKPRSPGPLSCLKGVCWDQGRRAAGSPVLQQERSTG